MKCFSLLFGIFLTYASARTFSHDEYLERLGSKGPYLPPKDLSLPDAAGCEPIMITGLARHGSRNPGKSDMKSYQKLREIFSDPTVNYTSEFKWLSSWESVYDPQAIHDLVNAGIEEHFGIGERLRKRFPSLFKAYSHRKHRFQSSYMERAARSALARFQALGKIISITRVHLQERRRSGARALPRHRATFRSRSVGRPHPPPPPPRATAAAAAGR